MKLNTAKVLVTLASAPGLAMYGQQLGRLIGARGRDEVNRELDLLRRLGWVEKGPVGRGGQRFWRLTSDGVLQAAMVKGGGHVQVQPVPAEVDWSARCCCRLELHPQPPSDRRWWWPNRDPEPPEHVRAVVRYGQLSALYTATRQSDGRWQARNEGMTRPWREIGLCWVGTPHMVVEVRRPL